MWPACSNLIGLCCPNPDGEMLECCQSTPVPGKLHPLPEPRTGENTTISKVGFPEETVDGRTACGSRIVLKSWKNPSYFIPIVFEGYRESSCSARGYRRYEKTETAKVERWVPYVKHNVTFEVWSHETNWEDTSLCIGWHCMAPLRKFLGDSFVQRIGASIQYQNACLPNVYTCLGDAHCSQTAKVMWPAIQECGTGALSFLKESGSLKMIECMYNCHGSKWCISWNCGAKAVKCFFDSECRSAALCFPGKLSQLSESAHLCMNSTLSPLCHKNLQCFAEAGGLLMNSLQDFVADANIADVVTCARVHC